jgi:hypothetical protein
MKFIRNRKDFLNFKNNLILENKDQAISILKKIGIDENNESYLYLKKNVEKIFKSFNYLGLMVSYHFTQEIPLQELKDLMPWLKENSSRLKNNPLEYKKFEDLKDEIIEIDNNQRVKTIYDLFPREQKNLINQEDKDFYEKSLEVHKIGMLNEFSKKLSGLKTREDIIEFMKEFINKNGEEINFEIITNKLRKLNSEIVYQNPDEGIVLAEIFDFKTSAEIGSQNWCIVTSEANWNSYTSGTRKQFFMWDFSKDRSDSQFMIGFTTNNIGQITHIHDKFDKSLKSDIPDNIVDLLTKIDISIDAFKYKNQLLKTIENNNIERIDDKENNDIIILHIKTNREFNSLRQESWGYYYNPIDDLYETYFVFNFKYSFNDPNFSYIIKSQEYKDERFYLVKDNLNKSYIKLTSYLKEYENLFNPMDVTNRYNDEEEKYLNKIEKYVKGDEKIENFRKKGEYINTSEDPGSTGNLWLFKLEELGLTSFFESKIISKWTEDSSKEIYEHNAYALINVDKNYLDKDFIRFITAKKGVVRVKYNIKEESIIKYSVNKNEVPEDIQNLIDKGYIKLKSNEEYNKEIIARYNKIMGEALEEYKDSKTNLYGRALFDYLVEVEYEGLEKENDFKKELIPDSEHYYLKSFGIYNGNINNTNYFSGIWAIGTNEEAEKSANNSLENNWEDLGVGMINSDYIPMVIDAETVKEKYGGDYYYYQELVNESPEDYGIEKTMTEEGEEELEKLNNDFDKYNEELGNLVDKKEIVENKIASLEKWYDDKSTKVYDLQKEAKSKNDKNRFDKLENILTKLENMFKRNIQRYELLKVNLEEAIENLEENIDSIQDEINYIEDEDTEYWEYSDKDIENAIQSEIEYIDRQIEDDPYDFLKEMFGGRTEQTNNYGRTYLTQDFTDFLKEFVSKEKIFKVIKDDSQYDRGSDITSYDGIEIEHEFKGNYYYIYRTN